MSESYGQRVAEAIEAEARDADVLVDVIAIPESLPGETVSHHVARLAASGDRFGCVMCWFLNWAVQRSHCQVTLDGGLMPWWVYPRAAFWFALAGYIAFRLVLLAISAL